jgi:hypothetical protein
MFNREKKRTRVEVLPPMGKYSVYAQHLSAVIGDDTLIYVGTNSGYLLPLGVDRTRFEERFFEAQIDRIFEQAGAQLDDALAAPEKFARYDWAAITGRFEETERHNAVYKSIKSEKDRERREEIAAQQAAAKKEAKSQYIEQFKTNAGIIASGGNFKVEAMPYSGKNNLLELFALYDIDVPLATKGWFNNKLVSFEVSANGGYTYRSYNNKGRRISYMGDAAHKKLNEIRAAVKAVPIAEKLAQKGLLNEAEQERPDEQNNESKNGGEKMEYSELQKKGFEYTRRHAHLPLDERLNIIAQAFGVKSASVYIEPCRGKYRGQSDIMLKLEGDGAMGIGMYSTATAHKDSTISDCVNNALAKYNPETVAETKALATSALKQREQEDNAVAAQKGLKPYKFLNVELSNGTGDTRSMGWYYVTLAVDGKVFGLVESNLASDIERGEVNEHISRPDYFAAGGLHDMDVDFVFNNVGFSSRGDEYKMVMSADARRRAEKTLAELSQSPSLTPDDKDFWREGIADFLAANGGKMALADLELSPFDNHGGLGKFFQVFGENKYENYFANTVAQENTRRTGEPWVVFGFCEGGDYRPDCLRTPTAMPFAEADKFIKGYEPKVREILDGGYDKLDITIYVKRDDNEVRPINDRYDIGDSKKISGLYNVLKAETDFYYAHPEIYSWKNNDEHFAEDKTRDYADIAILKNAVTAEYPYVEVEKVMRYADGDRLDQQVFYPGEILSFSEADSKIKTEEKAMRDNHTKKHGSPGDGDEELYIAVHFKLPGETEPGVFKFSYLLGDYDEEGSGLLKHFELGASYCNFCIREGNYGNVNATFGGSTPDDAIRLAVEYTKIYETLRDSMAVPAVKAVVERVVAVDKTFPDPTVSIADMSGYGYMDAESMLPLSQTRALELYDAENTVYLLYPDNTEAMALDREEIEQHDGLFGIEKPDWEKVRAADERASENKLESDFLLTTRVNMFGIYQVRDDAPNARDMRFVSLEELNRSGIEPNRSNYKLVYAAPFSDRIEFQTDRYPLLNRLFEQFNADQPADFTGRSMSVSDVVVLRYNGDMSAHYVDRVGFVEIGRPEFFGEPPENRTQTAERKPEPAEQTFFQNGKRSDAPTVAELEADVNAGKAISLLDLANAVHAEQKRSPAPKGRPDFLAKIAANKQRVAQASQSAAQKNTEREVRI